MNDSPEAVLKGKNRPFTGAEFLRNPYKANVVNLRASYQPIKGVELFLRINNVFDRRYALFGTYFDPSAAANVGMPIVLTDHRSEVLGQPLSVYGGIRVTF